MDDGLKKRLDFGIGEILLLMLVVTGIMEFFDILPADLQYIQKTISWFCLGYLLYNANLTEIIFGYKDKLIDICLIIAYFLFAAKNFIAYSKFAMEEIAETGGSLLVPLYSFMLDKAFTIELITLYLGGMIILILSLANLFMNISIKQPSIMGIIFEPGQPASTKDKILMAFSSFIIYSAFFAIVFNLIVEWLAWALDSVLLMLAVFFYLFFFIKNFRKLDAQSFLYKVGAAGDELYGKFISLFHSKSTLMLGISGLLVLHLVTDVGTFILPYIIGKNISYFASLGAGHMTLPSLFMIDIAGAMTLVSKISVVLVYLFNIFGVMVLFAGPAFIWYEMHSQRRIELPCIFHGTVLAAFFISIVLPIFRYQRINLEGVYGVDILTNTIIASNAPFAAITALVIMVLASLICYNHLMKDIARYISVLFVEIFFCFYIYLFFADISGFYMKAFSAVKGRFVLFYLFIFVASTTIFYIGGMFYFVYRSASDITKKFI